jgi:hypothetical protein
MTVFPNIEININPKKQAFFLWSKVEKNIFVLFFCRTSKGQMSLRNVVLLKRTDSDHSERGDDSGHKGEAVQAMMIARRRELREIERVQSVRVEAPANGHNHENEKSNNREKHGADARFGRIVDCAADERDVLVKKEMPVVISPFVL